MMTMARIALVSLALGCSAGAVAAQTDAPAPRRDVFTRAQIEASGIQRFSDLIAWVGTTTGTVEGLSWVFSLDELPTGLATSGSLPAPLILVDGLPVDLDAQQAQFPELLPLSLQQIDSVEVIREPGVAAGRVASRGILHFHTSLPGEGPALRVWGRHGAETGDPGPYQYTPESTPNVQRSGPDGLLALSYGRGRWDVEVTTRYVETAVDDSLVWAIHGEGPSYTAYARGGSVRAGWEVAGRRQQLLFSRHNQLGDTWIPGRGRIAHARITRTHLGVTGGIPVGRAGFSYHLGSSIGESSFSTTGENEFARATVDGSAMLSLPVRGAVAGVGFGFHRLKLDPVWTDEAVAVRSVPRALASLRSTGGEIEAGLTAEAALVEGRVSPRLLATFVATKEIGLLSAAFSYSSHLVDDLASWERALSFPDSAPFDGRLIRASIGLARPLGSAGAILEVDGTGGIWRARAAGPSPIAENGGQRFLGFSAGVRTATAGPVQGGVRYRGILARSLDEDGAPSTTIAPTHQLTAHLAIRLADSFRLGTSTLLKSPARWSAADHTLAGAFEPAPINRVDLSAEKWFWRGRLRTQFAVANVLGRTERYHPAGGDFALRYFVTAELVLR